jgi:hypothetical protein
MTPRASKVPDLVAHPAGSRGDSDQFEQVKCAEDDARQYPRGRAYRDERGDYEDD